ncbi:hypothetical protein O3P69_016915 [Scylla paramamosain]|uniref:Uncharacterized protein n=1 Tax=Scylla paramamosain TaxID=85552 RepID=A0AAW0TW94_SCYPA
MISVERRRPRTSNASSGVSTQHGHQVARQHHRSPLLNRHLESSQHSAGKAHSNELPVSDARCPEATLSSPACQRRTHATEDEKEKEEEEEEDRGGSEMLVVPNILHGVITNALSSDGLNIPSHWSFHCVSQRHLQDLQHLPPTPSSSSSGCVPVCVAHSRRSWRLARPAPPPAISELGHAHPLARTPHITSAGGRGTPVLTSVSRLQQVTPSLSIPWRRRVVRAAGGGGEVEEGRLLVPSVLPPSGQPRVVSRSGQSGPSGPSGGQSRYWNRDFEQVVLRLRRGQGRGVLGRQAGRAC